ncbi:MAG TPA: hypothetical protein DDZ51_24195 [Planctomycetaceae bacterium]|nr:hypothetical protein [Planctomycetaceae bacterium]
MISIRAGKGFFNRQKLDAAVERGVRKSLMQAGSFVRITARRLIKPAPKLVGRKRKPGQLRHAKSNTSRPGQPPRLHTRAVQNLRMIRFAWEPRGRMVIVGPQLFKMDGGVRIPQVLEHGGRSFIKRKWLGRKSIRVKKRPFMAPALKAEMPKFPNLFANSVKA